VTTAEESRSREAPGKEEEERAVVSGPMAAPDAAAQPEPALRTGVDSSAGTATRALTVVLVPFVAVWEVSKLALRRAGAARGGVTWVARQVGRVARQVGRLLAGGGHALRAVLRPLGAAARWCGSRLAALVGAIAKVCTVLAGFVVTGGRAVGRAIAKVARFALRLVVAAGLAVGWLFGPVVRAVGRAVTWLLRIIAAGIARAGAATRAALVRAGRAIRTVAAAVASRVGATLAALGRAIVKVARFALRLVVAAGLAVGWLFGPVVRAVGRAVTWLLRIIAAGIARAGAATRAALVRAGRAIRTVAAAVASRVGATLAALGRAMVAFGRVVAHVVAWVVGGVLVPLALVAKWAAALATAVARVVVGAGKLAGQVLATLARALARGLRLAAASLWRLVTPIGRAAATMARAGAGALVGLLKMGARGLVKAGTPVVALATATATALARGVGLGAKRLGGLLGHMAGAAQRGVGRPLKAGLTALGRAGTAILRPTASVVRRIIGHLAPAAHRAAAAIGRVARWPSRMAMALRSSVGRMVQGSLVAFGTARHQARLTPRAATGELELPLVSDGTPPEDDRPPTAVFTAESHQNRYLAPGGSQVEAIVSVTADIGTFDGRPREAVEIFLLDCSASMGHPWGKIRALRRATRAALAILPDGVWFVVVRGAESAEIVYPLSGGLVQASATTRREAAAAVGSLQPVGGTAIGRWLELATRLSALRPRALHHALLLTDGKDEDETEQELDRAVAACSGGFQCDCRGIGSDWAVSELRKISSALLGTVDIIREPADMEEDFRSITDAALARRVEASLQMSWPNGARVRFIRQVSPTIEDLTARARPVDIRTIEIPTGAWTTESREYHVSLEVPPGPLGAEMLASRLSVMVGDQKVAQALVKAQWTDQALLSAPISATVAHYTKQAELAELIQEGLAARRAGQEQTAADKLGRAMQLAAQSGRQATVELLANVVDVEDASTGRVRLKADVEEADEMTLDARSTRTGRMRGGAATGRG